jgi:hypothetical protein
VNREGLEQKRTLEPSTHTSPDRCHNPQHDAWFHHVYASNGPTGYRTGWRPNASSTRYLCANLLDCSQQAAEFNSNWLRGSTTPKQSKKFMHRHLTTTRVNFSRLGAHFLMVLRHFKVDDVIAAQLRSRGKRRRLILCVTTSWSVSGSSAGILRGQIEQHYTFSLKSAQIHWLTHWGRVTQSCVFTLQLCETDDANLRF